jgi:hypothetical protein
LTSSGKALDVYSSSSAALREHISQTDQSQLSTT